MDLTSSSEAKFGARSSQVHQIRGKLGNFCYYKTQKLGKNPNFGVKSEIQRAKFGYLSPKFLEAKFGVPTRISDANFGAKPPDFLIWKYPPGVFVWEYTRTGKSIPRTAFKQSNRKTASSPFKLIERHLIKRTM